MRYVNQRVHREGRTAAHAPFCAFIFEYVPFASLAGADRA
jgi:hypothetical protein